MKVFRPTIPPTAKPQIANPSGPAAQPMLAACCRWEGTDLILSVKVYPRSGKFSLGRVVGNALRVKVAAPPEAGRATEELLAQEPVQVIAELRRRDFWPSIKKWRRWRTWRRWYAEEPRRRGGPKSTPPCRVGLKCPACFVVGSRRLIFQSRLNPPPRIRDISDPSQSRPLLGQTPS